MGHKNKESLVKQCENVLLEKLKIGESKHTDKILGITDNHIYSWGTFKTYLRIVCRFVNDTKEKYGCKTIEEARQYADKWLHKWDSSPYTQKTYVAALCKLYGEHADNFIKTKNRERANIQRSRRDVVRDKHFSTSKNAELINFCKCTGLRRKELENIRGNQLVVESNDYFIHVKGKGGRWRTIPICGSHAEKMAVVRKMKLAGDNKVWGHIHSCADVHSYRREYCHRVYSLFARPIATLKPNEKYICRKDKQGIVYDRLAMKRASEALGHSRITVIAEHYL